MGGKDMGKDFLIGCYVIPDGIVVVKLLDESIFLHCSLFLWIFGKTVRDPD